MKKNLTSLIDKDWPEIDLEPVGSCPYCGASERSLAFNGVQDWSFYSAPGKWSYWDCKECGSLYLNPRPTEKSIGRAYSSYYTHVSSNVSVKESLKERLKNECFSHWLLADFNPRFNLPNYFRLLLVPLKKIIDMPFELPFLLQGTKGSVLDVGCGSGGKLKLAKSLGWDVTGLELDFNAVEVARSKSINVIHGDYKKLADFESTYDCVICSHVLEHVHEPSKLLELLAKVVKSNGTLLLSVPNARSHLRVRYSENWRGLEAPRHIAIPTVMQIVEKLNKLELFDIKQVPCHYNTLAETLRIQRRELKPSFLDFVLLKLATLRGKKLNVEDSDYIQLVVRKIESSPHAH